jgi:hypothetical protein
MKSGKTLQELAAEIERQNNAKRDFVVDTQAIAALPTENGVKIAFADQELTVGDTAHQQIAQRLNIPAKYYEKMRAEAPELLANNIETWFQKYPARNMVRTLDGKARAFLSDRYRPLDNFDLATAALPVLSELGVEVMSAEVTERRLYIKAVDRSVIREIPEGHTMGDGTHTIVRMAKLSPLVTLSNSEIGLGSLSILGGTFNSFCTNLATFGERSMRQYHVGGRHDIAEGDVYAMLSEQTRRLDDAALWAKVRDVIKGAFDNAKFDALVETIKGTQQNKMGADIPKVIEITQKRFDLSDGEAKSVLQHLIHGGDLTQYGLHNAITRTAEDLDDYDRATEFERIGGKVIELTPNDWREFAEAA